MKNERTSARVAKIAAKVMAIDPRGKFTFGMVHLVLDSYADLKWSDIRALAASALTQTADRGRRYHPDVPQPTADEMGFDPRDGGKVGRQRVPKRKRVLSARIKSKRPSSWPPSAKPPRRSP